MEREYIDGHSTNEEMEIHEIYGSKIKDVFMVKGCIRCNGVDECYVGMCSIRYKKHKEIARMIFNTYTRDECICSFPFNQLGKNLPCPVHKDWSRLEEEIFKSVGEISFEVSTV